MTDETANPETQAQDASAKASEAVSEVKEKTAAAAQKTRRKATTAAKRTTRSAKKQTEKVTDEAKASAGNLGSKVREGAQSAKERVQSEAEREFQKGKNRVVTQVSSVAGAFRKTSEQLRQEDQADLAGYTDRIADGVERVSDYLDDKGLRGAVSDLEGFARQRPGLFVGGALAVGLVAARFLRASGTRR